jgi:iron complex outermembrane recepter protein
MITFYHMGTSMRLLKLLLSTVLPLALISHSGTAVAQSAKQTSETERSAYNLPAQALPDALNAWARQSGVQILFPYDVALGKRSVAVRGDFSHRQALDQLLVGQPLRIASSTTNTVALAAINNDSPNTLGNEQSGGVIEEVIVTAQRRAESQKDVPITVTAFGARQAEALRLQSLQDVSRFTPGLLVASFSPGKPVIAIRGATNTFSQIGVDKPVGVFVDDVYIARNSAATVELFGINSIQVLKGPQGSLFGRNVTGGAIVIDTGKPSFEKSAGKLRSALAERQTREADAQFDLPIGETVAVRVAGMTRQNDGWGRDRLSGQRLDDQESTALRAQLRWAISDRVEMLLAADTSDDASGGRTLSSLGAGDDGNRRTAETGTLQAYTRKGSGLSARFYWNTDLGELASITAQRATKSTDIFSNVGTNFRFLTGTQSQALTDDRDDVVTLSQEVRFASKLWTRGSFVVGGYYAQEDSERDLLTTALAAGTGNLVTNQRALQTVDATTAAIFLDGTWNINDVFGVTVGGRYTWDEKTASLTRTNAIQPTTNFSVRDLSEKWDEFTPRLVLKAQPIENATFFASLTTGYTAGGYNTEAATVAALSTPFAPETVTNFEVGVKSSWLDNRLRFNLSIFNAEYKDKQELFFNNITRILNITNASEATMRGFETDVMFQLTNWLSLSATYGYLDTRYDNFIIPGGANNTGNDLGSSPRNKASFLIDLDKRFDQFRLFGNIGISSTSGYYTGAARDPNLFVRSYQLVNGQIGVSLFNDRIDVAAYGRNLMDEDYLLIPSVQVVRGEYLGQPRTIGLSVSVKY